MASVIIERKVPIPPSGRGKWFKYPFAEMKIGDSIIVPEVSHSVITVAARRTGFKFTSRRIDAKNRRVWRIK